MINRKDLLGASVGMLVLGVVAKNPSYGYDILRKVNAEAGDLFVWQEGMLYPVLHKLEKQKLLRSQWQDSESGRQRKYYYITSAGRASLREGLSQWTAINRLVLKLTGVNNE